MGGMGDGRRNLAEQVAGRSVDGHADRASDQRVFRHRRAPNSPQDYGRSWSKHSKRIRQSVWGGGSAGGTDHILIGLIAKAIGGDPSKINYVPFKGGGEAISAIVGGHVTAGVSGLGEFAEQIKAGRMRALAVSSPAAIDNIPTLKDQGIDVVLGNWRGVFAAPSISPAQRDALVAAVKTATDSPAWKESLTKFGWTRGTSAAISTKRSSKRM